ncbi:MAG: LamG domain-containing protein [Acidobacteriota bacterium]
MKCLRLVPIFWAIFSQVRGQGVEGGAERYRFEPGDRVIYEAQLAPCPVGEFLDEWKIARGSFECARFEDRIWIRPLESGTTLYLAFPEPLPEEFSLECVVRSFEAGRPALRFGLHPVEIERRLAEGNYFAADEQVLLAGVIAVGDASVFGAKDQAQGSLEGRWDFRRVLPPGRDHHIALQVRRNQVRFYVDGERVGHKPFRPERPLQVLTLYFRRLVEASESFSEAPVLVRDLRIAGYSRRDRPPQPEADLIRDLGAEQTAEGLRVTLAEAILFDLGRWALKPEAQPVLEKLANLAQLRQGAVRVEGHTDDTGAEQFNLVLSELRAHVVALELARLGVEPQRLRPRGFGEARPLVPNDSEANRARNRRVEVLFAVPEKAGDG